MAYEITPDDIENVLRQHAARLVNADCRSIEDLANELIDEIDLDEAESAALGADGDLDAQTEAAYANLHDQLVEIGALRA